MKNLLVVIALIFASSSLFAQTVTIQITGLSNSAITVKSANLEEVSLKDARGQASNTYAYVISRNQNELSAAILSAATKKAAYSKAVLTITLKNGKKIIHDLNQVSLRSYTSTNVSGKTPMEEFYLIFATDVIRGTKQ